MELLVAALAVAALVAIAVRFGLRGPSGGVHLPRIVDDSIGMWALRRLTGRPLLGRPAGDRPDPFARFRRPSTTLATRVPPPARPGRARPLGTSNLAAPGTAEGAQRPEALTEPGVRGSASWQVIPRRPPGRAFGSSILPIAEPARRTGRATAVLGYLGLAIVVAVVAFIAGAALGGASAPVAPSGASGSGTGATNLVGSSAVTTYRPTEPAPVPTSRQP
jgi:hypothetical protein